jgi:hypothetical protein
MPKNPTPNQSATSVRNGSGSNGPKTKEGKEKVRHNALKHSLTGEHVTLPGESVPAFEGLLDACINRMKPVDEVELRLVHDLAETEWKIARAKVLFRQAVFNRIQIQEKEVDNTWNNPHMALRSTVAHAYELSEGGGKNLALYESRLRRQRQQIMRDLKQFRDDFPPADELLAEIHAMQNENRKNEPENPVTNAPTMVSGSPDPALSFVYFWETDALVEQGPAECPEPLAIGPDPTPPEVQIMRAAA